MGQSNLIKYLNDDNFNAEIAKGVVLVDFYADWCGPCKMLNPVIEDLAKEMEGKATIAKVDTDQSLNTAAHYEVTSIPTLILFKEGQIVERIVGLRSLDNLRQLMTKAL